MKPLAVDIAMSHVERAHGAAQRRRARLVRSWWRHQQRSIAATVATMLHHSAGRKPHPTMVDAATQVGPQFSTTAVDPYAPRVVGSLPPVEEFTGPVFDQVHQELVALSEMTENFSGNPCCARTGDRSGCDFGEFCGNPCCAQTGDRSGYS